MTKTPDELFKCGIEMNFKELKYKPLMYNTEFIE